MKTQDRRLIEPIMSTITPGVVVAVGGLPGILLDRKQPNIEGPLGEPDERDGDHRQ